ncbi:MAG: sulfatase-like hydrolase/transferase [Deltaproteobacteria bacterium]|nr:sulfatase-like hydrolase/transferase [Deltaproteobacteria bacterium]MBW2691254.1 sulfatase-like hydrolase/transferase [Deltaproteobacteria bacterium]
MATIKSPRRAAVLLAVCVSVFGSRAEAQIDSTRIGSDASSILLVTFDTVRADRIGAYGYLPARTPTLDGLAARGILFESAVSATPTTLPSHASILTGTYPSAHGVHDNGVFALERDAVLISEVFQQRGFRTAAFVGTYILDASFGLDQGFEAYRGPASTLEFRMHEARRSANEVVDDAISWFEQLDRGERFFVWVHFYDPHRPLAERDAGGRKIENPYDFAISACDRELGRLLRFIDSRGLAENLLTVVTADHGESNGEHGESTHGVFVYQSAMRVPLIFSGGPLAEQKGVRVNRTVTNAAIVPTLLNFAGLPETEMPAVRLRTLLTTETGGTPSANAAPILLQSLTPYYNYRWRGLRGVLWREYKLVHGSTPELYALKEDPGELADVADKRSDLVAELSRQLENLVAEHAPLGWAASRTVTADETELLASLGYAEHYTGEDPFDPTLPDPRDRIGDIELINEAGRNFRLWGELSTQYATAWQRDQNGRHFLEKARALVLELRERNPRDPSIPMLLGAIESELRNYDAAIPLLEQAARESPLEPVQRARLADTYAKAQRPDDAIREMQKAIDLDPEQSAYHQMLIGYALQAQRFDDALRSMDRYVGAMKDGSPEHRNATSWVAEQKRRIPAGDRRSAPKSTAESNDGPL